MQQLLNSAESTGVPFEIVSVSDVYTPRRDEVKTRPSATTATTSMDYREVLDDKSVDAVIIATPDHWHVRIAVAALAAGKDVYLEKPMVHTNDEARQLVATVKETKRILKAAFAEELPPEVLNRKKAGFPVPYGMWLRKDLKKQVADVLLSDRARSRGYYKPREVERLLS